MIESKYSFQKQLNDKNIVMTRNYTNQMVHNFKWYMINTADKYDQEIKEIKEQKNESKIKIINKINKFTDLNHIIIFDGTIIFISQTDVSLIFNLINNSKESTIYTFDYKIKSFLPEDFQKIYIILKFLEIISIWTSIFPSFSSYFIYKSYTKLQENRIKFNYLNLQNSNTYEIKNDNY